MVGAMQRTDEEPRSNRRRRLSLPLEKADAADGESGESAAPPPVVKKRTAARRTTKIVAMAESAPAEALTAEPSDEDAAVAAVPAGQPSPKGPAEGETPEEKTPDEAVPAAAGIIEGTVFLGASLVQPLMR